MHLRRLAVCAGTIALLLGLASPAAATTPLDPTFGAGGLTTSVWNPTTIPVVEALAVLPDGKILVAGSAIPKPTVGHTNGDLIVGRLLPGGAVDSTFGDGGRMTILTTPACTSCYSQHVAGMAVQPDGKIVLATSRESQNGDGQPALTRLTAEGQLDTAFGNGGDPDTLLGNGRTIPPGIAADTGTTPSIFLGASGLAINPDGTITWVGHGFADHLLVRFTASGRVDTTYGTGGRLSAVTPGMQADLVATALPVGDGSILTAGSTSKTWYADSGCTCGDGLKLAIVHITASGTFADASAPNNHIKVFGDGTDEPHVAGQGVATNDSISQTLAVRPGGAGWFTAFSTEWTDAQGKEVARPPGSGIGVAAVNAYGTTTQTGFVERPDKPTVLDAKTDPAGRLYVLAAETFFPFGTFRPVSYELLRFTASGTLDATFGDAGILQLDQPYKPTRIATSADGSVLVAGQRFTAPIDAQVVRIPASALGGPVGGGPTDPGAPADPGGGTPQGGAPANGTPAAETPAVTPAVTPALAVTAGAGLPSTLRASKLAGLKVGVTCSGACQVAVGGVIQLGGSKPPAAAKKKAKVKLLTFKPRTVTLTGAGTATTTLAVTPAQLKTLRKALGKKTKAWLTITLTGPAPSAPVTRVVTLQP